jgi:hypothetical protein
VPCREAAGWPAGTIPAGAPAAPDPSDDGAAAVTVNPGPHR